MRQHGTVLRYSVISGYGFLLADETHEEIFVSGEEDLTKGDRVTFVIVPPARPGQKRRAVNVSREE